MDHLFAHYADAILNTKLDAIADASQIPSGFALGRQGRLSAHYIPFEQVNRDARLVLVGITPGFTQWKNAVAEAQRQLRAGATHGEALAAAKRAGAFSGNMRPNLIDLLDQVGLADWLGIRSCSALFGENAILAQSTSLLRHPIFVDGANYNGTPSMIKSPFLQEQLLTYFAGETAQLDNPLYIPLGPKVNAGLQWLAARGVIDEGRILTGLPHPSGANGERIAYFLGRKDRAALSPKTNATRVDTARAALIKQVAQLA